MDDPHHNVNRPIAVILSYARRRPISHLLIVGAVLAAVACATGTQYGVKSMVDALSRAPGAMTAWGAFALLVSLILPTPCCGVWPVGSAARPSSA